VQLIQRDLRTPEQRVLFLKNDATAYNFRLLPPRKNLQTYEECMEQEEFGEFFSSYKDKWLGCTMAEAKEDMKRFNVFPFSP